MNWKPEILVEFIHKVSNIPKGEHLDAFDITTMLVVENEKLRSENEILKKMVGWDDK